MNLKNIPIVVMLVSAAAAAVPCRAQNPSSTIPVLTSYTDQKWIYFAPLIDEALIFEKYPSDASNVWVAIERFPANRQVIAKTDVWTDRRGCPHTVSILKYQLEFNSLLAAARQAGMTLPNSVSEVSETGILDRQTLGIPHAKLSIRIKKVSDRLAAEIAAAAGALNANPGEMTLKQKYASYLSEKVSNATARLDELNRAFDAVPRTQASDEAARPRATRISLTGLTRLAVPVAAQGYLKVSQEDSRLIRFVESSPTVNPELFTKEYVALLGMTPTVVADLQEKESAAAKAVVIAENLCKDLLDSPCQ